MGRRLPSLNALKAFEAAARHGSFTLAAEELFVTHAAVSRHIRDLEEWLGVELFTRTGRGVVLTESGRRYGGRLGVLFDGLAEATRDVVAAGGVRKLTVTVQPAFAARWLVPRLGRFSANHPDIELDIDPDERVVDLRVSEAELGIRYGSGRWEGIEAIKLAELDIFPVCAPSLLAGRPAPGPADLGRYTLLHEDSKEWWSEWLVAAGAVNVDAWRGPSFKNHLALDAAEAGQGFALSDQVVVIDALDEGWLTRPFDLMLRDPGSYFLVRARGTKETAPARAFREWILGEMAETTRRFAALKGRRTAA